MQWRKWSEMSAPKSIIEPAGYRRLNVMNLPSPLNYDLCAALELRNDSSCVVNPEYHPALAEWLKENGEDPTECFLAWASW